MPTVSVRLSEEALDDLDEAADLLGQDRSTTIRKALDEGLSELRMRYAVERYQSGDVAINEAAALAGLSVAEWLEVANDRNLTTQLSAGDLQFDVDHATDL